MGARQARPDEPRWEAIAGIALVAALGCGDAEAPPGGEPLPCDDGGEVGEGCTLAPPCPDADADGHADPACGGHDCDDADPQRHPGALEIPCNGADDDCSDGTMDEADADGDGATTCAGDCRDDLPAVGPGVDEAVCNLLDDDCNPRTLDDPGTDRDGDGASACVDCNDDNVETYPGALEFCGDRIDSNCDRADPSCAVCGNGVVEEGEACDEGDTVAGDGCRADCLGFEVCGDGLADLAAGEDCDPPQDGPCLGGCVACACPEPPGPWGFADVAAAAGVGFSHAYDDTGLDAIPLQLVHIAGGVAVGDYDDDGFYDLYLVGGSLGDNHLLHNQGDGTFADVATAAGVGLPGTDGSGPLFADLDGDGAIDLLVGGILGAPLTLFANQLDGTFADVTAGSGLDVVAGQVVGSSAADIDEDGDLDVMLARWGTPVAAATHLFTKGPAGFVAADVSAGLAGLGVVNTLDATFAPNFTDVNGDGWLDLLVASDFGSSRVFVGAGGGLFNDATTPVISDENGMGAAIGDYDADGDFDWFVTSILDPNGVAEGNWGTTGNRLYENDGGTFTDATDAAGVRIGHWGWAACFADFDLDSHLDLFHVNGFDVPASIGDFGVDPSVLYHANGDGTFTERALELGIDDHAQGRGVVCFDYDRDGDIDIFVANNGSPPSLWRNNGAGLGHFLSVELAAPPPNAQAIGARVTLVAAGFSRTCEIRAGSQFVSQPPALCHFGLGVLTAVDDVIVGWPDGSTSAFGPVAGDQFLVLSP